jgi:hypothetical protein
MKEKRYIKDINKNNDYIKLYFRIIKEQNLYNNKDFLSKYRYEKDYPTKLVFGSYIKQDSILYNLEIPNMLIAANVEYEAYLGIHRMYMSYIAETIVIKLIARLQKQKIIEENITVTQKKEIINNIIKKYEKNIKTKRENPKTTLIQTITAHINNFVITKQKLHDNHVTEILNNMTSKKINYNYKTL